MDFKGTILRGLPTSPGYYKLLIGRIMKRTKPHYKFNWKLNFWVLTHKPDGYGNKLFKPAKWERMIQDGALD